MEALNKSDTIIGKLNARLEDLFRLLGFTFLLRAVAVLLHRT